VLKRVSFIHLINARINNKQGVTEAQVPVFKDELGVKNSVSTEGNADLATEEFWMEIDRGQNN